MGDLDGYNAMDKGRLAVLRGKYKVDFAVIRRGQERNFEGYPVAYANRGYAVLDVREKR